MRKSFQPSLNQLENRCLCAGTIGIVTVGSSLDGSNTPIQPGELSPTITSGDISSIQIGKTIILEDLNQSVIYLDPPCG